MFSSEFCEIFKNTLYCGTPLVAASEPIILNGLRRTGLLII